ncbi:MAG: FAD-binding protein [Deltaproteobacteria bacterium]|nr:FAD-binding protein [Deltaproteobacteria bacterium]MBT4267649.1 FAD-binding protein [Deltaproteobacteria bacterium]MBT4642263.1 FAD-binding protein [Deltaproteobacteria bacterium]MBT6502527.1 FAD-binding protein [Deltaproteobacteria bacterium]MBT7155168.1 FAD-binding protein [Deltaproteobacteria bacterium]
MGTPTIKEMETLYGCFFDRNQDGTVHQKPFAGQSFDRTVHKGDLTGIEIVSRLTEQIMKRNIRVLEENRAVDLLLDASGKEITGTLLLDIKHGIFREVNARCVLVATGGGPTQYRFFAPGPEKSVDGLGMLFRVGVLMRDMEIVQFHPTGLIIPGSVVAGSLLEEGLRGAGAYILNGKGERFMEKYDPENMERTIGEFTAKLHQMSVSRLLWPIDSESIIMKYYAPSSFINSCTITRPGKKGLQIDNHFHNRKESLDRVVFLLLLEPMRPGVSRCSGEIVMTSASIPPFLPIHSIASIVDWIGFLELFHILSIHVRKPA